MKAIILSVRPEWVAKILNGEKTIEIRKSVPKDFNGWVYIYCFKEKKYGNILVKWDNDIHELYSKTPKYEMTTYSIKGIHNMGLNGKVVARFWFDVKSAFIFDKNINDYRYGNMQMMFMNTFLKCLQVEYSDIIKYGKGKDLYAWHIKNLEVFDTPKELNEFERRYAPQSWCYVEVKEVI